MSAAKFGMHTTALEIIEKLKINLTGYEAIVTGASSGIGIETARALAKRALASSSPSEMSSEATKSLETYANRLATTKLKSKKSRSTLWLVSTHLFSDICKRTDLCTF